MQNFLGIGGGLKDHGLQIVYLKKLHYDQNIIKPITLVEYLDKFPVNQVVDIAASSLGNKGYYEVWLNGS
jgi:predicted glycosyl hydrolase (DUF1957 family)